jgi:hypothetical protein
VQASAATRASTQCEIQTSRFESMQGRVPRRAHLCNENAKDTLYKLRLAHDLDQADHTHR